MRHKFSVPSRISVVPDGEDVLRFVSRDGNEIGSVCATSLGDLLRLNLGGVPIVARGDLLSPAFRRWLATDVRLSYSPRMADRTELLRMLSDIAVAWDAHRSGSTCGREP